MTLIIVNSSISLFSTLRHSPLPVRRVSNPYKDSKPSNNRLSVVVRAQQRNSPRSSNGDRSKPSKAKEKKETKEVKESAGKAKEDKVSNLFMIHYIPCLQTKLFALLVKHGSCSSIAKSSLSFQFSFRGKSHGSHVIPRNIMFYVSPPEQRRCPGERSKKV